MRFEESFLILLYIKKISTRYYTLTQLFKFFNVTNGNHDDEFDALLRHFSPPSLKTRFFSFPTSSPRFAHDQFINSLSLCVRNKKAGKFYLRVSLCLSVSNLLSFFEAVMDQWSDNSMLFSLLFKILALKMHFYISYLNKFFQLFKYCFFFLDEGGGYFVGNEPTTPNQSVSSAIRQQFLCPVTVRQVLEAPEQGLKVGSLTATMVS